MAQQPSIRVAVLGASGGVGRRVVARLLAAHHDVRCQTRTAAKLAEFSGRAEIHAFDPRDASQLAPFIEGVDAVVFALGVDRLGATTLFSDVTSTLIGAMRDHGVRRLVVITGVGAGETRGHGGFVYDWIIFPLFTRNRYRDKERQEELIARSDLDWVIVRPAPFVEKTRPTPLEVHTTLGPRTRLTGITRDEVADFVVAQITSDAYLRQFPFIGHP